MKTLLLLTAWLAFFNHEPSLLIVDKNLKKPFREANHFTLQHYWQHCFPVYAAEREELIAAANRVVKWMDEEQPCYSSTSLGTEHTTFVVSTDCQDRSSFSVMMVTHIDETETSFSFAVVASEESKRKAQRQVLDFAAYMEQ